MSPITKSRVLWKKLIKKPRYYSQEDKLTTLGCRYLAVVLTALFVYAPIAAFGVTETEAKALAKWRAENDWSSDNRQTDGKTRLGFTHQRSNGQSPRWNDWCKLLDSGKARYWEKFSQDKNGNGQPDGDEIINFDYWFWYQVKVDVQFEWERSWTGMEWLQRSADSLKNARLVQIGDKAVTNDNECYVLKGPIWIHASIRVGFDTGDYLHFSDMGTWSVPYSGIMEKAQFQAKHDQYIKQQTDILHELVRSILATTGGRSATPAPQKSEPKPPAKEQPKGKPGLTLTSSAEMLWADGKSTSNLKLVACDANGSPIKGSFDIDVKMGKCSHVKFITDATGTAVATYTAPIMPGEDVITVAGPGDQKASLTIRLGGLLIVPTEEQTALFCDGKSKVGLKVVCGDPNFKPLAGAKVKLFVNEKEAPAKGALSAPSVVIGQDGTAEFTYTAPDALSAKTDFKRGNIYVAAIASLGNPPREVRSDYRVPLYAGESYFLTVEKTGFASVEKFAVPAPNRNGVLSGMLVLPDGEKMRPIANANLTLADAKGKPVGLGTSNTEGEFRFEFVGDQMSNVGQTMEMSEPIRMALDPDLLHLMSAWKEDLDILAKSKYDVNSLREFREDLPKNLAGSVMGCKDPMCSTEYLAYTAAKLVWTCRYVKLLDDRQLESADWFLESAKNIITTVSDFAGVSDKLESAAKGKLKEKFEPKTWQKFEESMLREFLDLFYKQFQKGIDVARTLNYDTADLDALQKSGASYVTTAAIDKLNEKLKESFQAVVHHSSQKILTQAGGRALLGQFGTALPSETIPAAKEVFTSYEKEHNALNIANLDRELYRLDAKLFVDTVIKGPFVYLKLKKLVMDPDTIAKINELDIKTLEDIQEEFISSGDAVGKVFSAFDLAFQSYQGYNWLADFAHAGSVRQQLARILSQ